MSVLITEGSQLDSRFCSHILKKTPFEGDKNNLTIQVYLDQWINITHKHSQDDQSVTAINISI